MHDFQKLHVKVRSEASSFSFRCGGFGVRLASDSLHFLLHFAENGHLELLLDSVGLLHVLESVNPVLEVDGGDVVIELSSKLSVLFIHFIRELTRRDKVELFDNLICLVDSSDQRVGPDSESTVVRVRHGHRRAFLRTSNIELSLNFLQFTEEKVVDLSSCLLVNVLLDRGALG
jgi:hypothetical protein